MRSQLDMDVLQQVWVILLLIATIACPAECQRVSYRDPRCFNTSACPCCSVPCPSDGSGHCGGHCTDGYHGGKCYNICPENCIRCVDAQQGRGVANCTLCKGGYFSTESMYQCQSACSGNCTTCESRADNCTSCQDGYYVSESHHCVKCNDTCLTCNSPSSCTSCRLGFYLDKVHEHCEQCNPLCSSCNSSDTCICSNGCTYNWNHQGCQGETNICIYGCRLNFTSNYDRDRCDQCIDGNYGIECDLQCQTTCESTQCERISGNCFRCRLGHYGDKCGMNCPTNCQSTCDKTTGLCDSCKRGFYGNNCTLHCPTPCQECTYKKGRCTTCVRGFYGENCEVTCPENCKDGTCNKTYGNCFNCVPGFMGLSCEVSIIITTSGTNGPGPPLIAPTTPQTFVGVGLRGYIKRNLGISSGNRSWFGITSHMSNIEKMEKEMASIDSHLIKLNAQLIELNTQLIELNTALNKLNTQLNKLGSSMSELGESLETLRNNMLYRITSRADNVEDKSYEMLQREKNESQYSTLQ